MNQVWWSNESEFWRAVGNAAQADVSRLSRMQQWPVGTVLLAQGAEEGIFGIQAGRVRLLSPRGAHRELTLARLGPGEVFGRATWLQHGVAGAQAVVTEPLTGWHLDREGLERLLREMPEVTGALADGIHRLWQVGGSLGPAAGRVWRLLSAWARDHGQAGPQGTLVPGMLAPAEIAELVGATREEVERCLRSWRAAGALRDEADHFCLRPGPVAG